MATEDIERGLGESTMLLSLGAGIQRGLEKGRARREEQQTLEEKRRMERERFQMEKRQKEAEYNRMYGADATKYWEIQKQSQILALEENNRKMRDGLLRNDIDRAMSEHLNTGNAQAFDDLLKRNNDFQEMISPGRTIIKIRNANYGATDGQEVMQVEQAKQLIALSAERLESSPEYQGKSTEEIQQVIQTKLGDDPTTEEVEIDPEKFNKRFIAFEDNNGKVTYHDIVTLWQGTGYGKYLDAEGREKQVQMANIAKIEAQTASYKAQEQERLAKAAITTEEMAAREDARVFIAEYNKMTPKQKEQPENKRAYEMSLATISKGAAGLIKTEKTLGLKADELAEERRQFEEEQKRKTKEFEDREARLQKQEKAELEAEKEWRALDRKAKAELAAIRTDTGTYNFRRAKEIADAQNAIRDKGYTTLAEAEEELPTEVELLRQRGGLSDREKTVKREVAPIAVLSVPAASMTQDEQGLVDQAVRKFKEYTIGEEPESQEAVAAFNHINSQLRHDLFGATLTANELRNSKETLGDLNTQFVPLMTRLKQSLLVEQSKLLAMKGKSLAKQMVWDEEVGGMYNQLQTSIDGITKAVAIAEAMEKNPRLTNDQLNTIGNKAIGRTTKKAEQAKKEEPAQQSKPVNKEDTRKSRLFKPITP